MNIRQWIAPRSTDERVARREELVNILSLTSGLLGVFYLLVLVVIALLRGDVAIASMVGGVACIVLAVSAYALSRRGHIDAAALAIVVAAAFIGLYSNYVRGAVSVAAVMLVPPVLFAGVALGGRAGGLAALVVFALNAALVLVQTTGMLPPLAPDLSPLTGLVLVASALGLIALVLWQTLRAMDTVLRKTEGRGQELQALADDKDRLLREVEAREEAQRRLLETVRELGSPIIPLAEGILAMPLVGTIDSGRAQDVMTALLHGVAAQRARVAIVDITGVSIVDTAVANALMQTAQGVRLLGATPVLVGIRAEVAQTLVDLGLDLHGVVTRADLREGLEYALGRIGARIVAREEAPPAPRMAGGPIQRL